MNIEEFREKNPYLPFTFEITEVLMSMEEFRTKVEEAYPDLSFTFEVKTNYVATSDDVSVLFSTDDGWAICTNQTIGWGDTLEQANENFVDVNDHIQE